MKVAISVPGRFHLFNLAQELLKRDYLAQLITSYPKFEVVKYNMPKDKINSVISKEILYRAWQKFPKWLRDMHNPQYAIHELFDRRASRKLKPADIVIGGSSVFLHTLRKAKQQGAVTVVEHGSSHIEYQSEILDEEYKKFSIPFEPTDRRIIEKELEEYEEVDYISIPSSYVKQTFLERDVPEEKIIQVPYGVDLSSFHQVGKEDDVFRVVFAGGMSIRKGVHYLLRAFTELNLPNSELMLLGGMTDEMKPFFKQYEGHYKYVGHVPQSELYKYYSQGSVFVIMSVEEGLALVQPQAMACGLPVICTENTGGGDIVRDGIDGFVIPIRAVDVLKEKLTYLYEHPDTLRQMGESAKERVSSGFTWDDYGNKVIHAYERILGGTGSQ